MLSALADLFVHRKQINFFWVPVAWAIATFCLLIINWWQFFAVSQRLEEWTFDSFALAILQVVTLFIGSSLILPRHWTVESVDLYDFFRDQGRWGVAGYCGFFLLAVPSNILLWGGSALSSTSLLVLGIVITCLGTIFSRTRGQASGWTVAFIGIQLLTWTYVIYPSIGG